MTKIEVAFSFCIIPIISCSHFPTQNLLLYLIIIILTFHFFIGLF
uniref:Uncharacterized protein n=1 Tax=Rhizophora mucronata TaxID=61149 RepID=A0A2P2PRX6_RHIMU